MLRRLLGRRARVVVLGLDGVPYGMVRRLVEEGMAPNLARLARRGTLTELRASVPEVSSVSWSCFMTGQNPAVHGIFGFTDLDGYRLRFPNFSDLRAPTLFDRLAERGGRSVVINLPATYPARPLRGVLVSGFVAVELRRAVVGPRLPPRGERQGEGGDGSPGCLGRVFCKEGVGLQSVTAAGAPVGVALAQDGEGAARHGPCAQRGVASREAMQRGGDHFLTKPVDMLELDVFLRKALETSPVKDRIIHLNYVERRELAGLYRMADAFLFPSWLEGFGLPVLEAMACGVPVITSEAPALVETTGEAALHVAAGEVEALAEAMRSALTDHALRERLRAAGLGRAARFTWPEAAEATRGVYREAAECG